MSWIRAYLAYLKENPHGYWFKARLYGWGWTPARWQGWAVIASYVALLALNAFRLEHAPVSKSRAAFSLIWQTFILTGLLLAACWKTGERPRWQWGLKTDGTGRRGPSLKEKH